MQSQFFIEELNKPFAQNLSNSYTNIIVKKQKYSEVKIDKKGIISARQLLIKPIFQQKCDKAICFYVENYFKGINDQDYLVAHKREQFFKEKLTSLQEIDHQVQEKKNIFQEKELASVKIVETNNNECSKCQSQGIQRYFEVDKNIFCEQCALVDQPEQVSRLKLKLLVKKNESKGSKYEEKLKQFYEKSLKELKQKNQLILNSHN